MANFVLRQNYLFLWYFEEEKILMQTEFINVLIGGDCELAEQTAKYLAGKGLSVKNVEINPLKIQYEAMKQHYDVVLIYFRTKFPRSLCENLKSIDDPPILMLLRDNNTEPNGFSGLENHFSASAVIPDDNEYLYEKIMETVKNTKRKKPYQSIASAISPLYLYEKNDFELHNTITGILNKLYVNARYNGYNYIREAIKLAVTDSSSVKGISKQIYPDVAAKLGVTAAGVERSMRTAIHKAWNIAEPSAKVEIFGTYALKDDWIPTNSEFIYIIADKISCDMNRESV